jgi:hypothetical protein
MEFFPAFSRFSAVRAGDRFHLGATCESKSWVERNFGIGLSRLPRRSVRPKILFGELRTNEFSYAIPLPNV